MVTQEVKCPCVEKNAGKWDRGALVPRQDCRSSTHSPGKTKEKFASFVF